MAKVSLIMASKCFCGKKSGSQDSWPQGIRATFGFMSILREIETETVES